MAACQILNLTNVIIQDFSSCVMGAKKKHKTKPEQNNWLLPSGDPPEQSSRGTLHSNVVLSGSRPMVSQSLLSDFLRPVLLSWGMTSLNSCKKRVNFWAQANLLTISARMEKENWKMTPEETLTYGHIEKEWF